MSTMIRCPHCKAHLDVGNKVVFSIKRGDWEGVLALHRDLGNYTYSASSGFKFDKGDIIEFYCPVCRKSLESETHENLARVLMSDDNGIEREVFFSRVAGEKSTYCIIDKEIEHYGKDSGRYLDFFNLTFVN